MIYCPYLYWIMHQLSSVSMDPCLPKGSRWRFNTSLLYDTIFLDQLRQDLYTLLEMNSWSCPNPQVLWEVTKCFLQRYCISYCTKLTAVKNKCFSELESKINSLEPQQSCSFFKQTNHINFYCWNKSMILYPWLKLKFLFREQDKSIISIRIDPAGYLRWNSKKMNPKQILI